MKIAVTTLAFCVAALLALGMVMLYSTSMAQGGGHYLLMQLAWCGLGLMLCVAAASLDYRLLKKFAVPIFILAVAMLALVLVPHIGRKINGPRRWFDLHVMLFQPSEFAKLAVIIMIAWYGDRYQRHMQTWSKGIFLPGIILATALGLIFVEPDRGTTILLAAVGGAMLLVAGVQWKYILPPFALALVGLVISLLHDPMRARRIFAWLNPEEHKTGVGYQAYQAMLALGSGGWTGLGLGNGRQKLGFVPEQRTDFIFSIIGEELGLITTLLVVLTFMVLVVCGLCISINARDRFGLLLGTGISFLIGLQAFINIGVVTSALPNKGLPLPFISYGGSSMLAMLTCVGVLFGIARQAQTAHAVPRRAAETDDLTAKQRT